MAEDARYRTRFYLSSYILDANLTKDDDATEVDWISQYTYPPYPLKRIFFEPKNVDLIFNIDTPVTTPRLDFDGSIIGYNEKVPILIQCVTKQGITGNKLRWKADAELRRVVETYPLGSYRSISRAEPFDTRMGNWIIYGIKDVLTHERDTT